MNATVTCTKVAWVRDQSVPPGKRAKGQLRCRCGNAPMTDFNASQGDVTCACGAVYTWDGWVVSPAPAAAAAATQST